MSYILIVDDDHNMAQTLSDMVGLFDWNTQIVTSPRAAIESLNRNPPALILLDLNMPGVDGMEVCRYIKRDPITGSTPVVFVTAEDDPGTKVKAREAGATDYLVKPVDVDRLEQVLEKLPTKPGEKPAAAIALAAAKAATTSNPPPPQVIQSTPVQTPSQPSTPSGAQPSSAPASPPASQPVPTPASPAAAQPATPEPPTQTTAPASTPQQQPSPTSVPQPPATPPAAKPASPTPDPDKKP